MYAISHGQTTTAIFGFVAILCILLWSFQHHSSSPSTTTSSGAPRFFGAGRELADDIFNSTLGFEKLFVINLPERSDHRDALSLMGAVSDIKFDYVDAVKGETIPDRALPIGDPQRFNNAGRGSWRAHMNAIRTVVEQNLTSALIFEDDVDWDIRIKKQLYDFSKGSRVLVQPLDKHGVSYADTTFPQPQDPDYQPQAILSDRLPRTQEPLVSPYGDNWDLLWLGHCGNRRPVANMAEPWGSIARNIPKGHVVQENDPTAPIPKHIHVYDDAGHPGFRRDFPPHSRVVHHSMDAICSLVYAVSQAGARKILYDLAVQRFDDLFDIMLRQFCDGQTWHDTHTCLTVQPTLFDHHRPPGLIAHDSDLLPAGGGTRNKGFTLNIRWSTRLNIPKLLKGETDYIDSYPD